MSRSIPRFEPGDIRGRWPTSAKLDQDYDRRSFLISQAFFPGAGPGGDPWKRLWTALRGWVDPDQFEMLRGTQSLPFRAGEQRRVAVKVIDFRGNEAIRILDLP